MQLLKFDREKLYPVDFITHNMTTQTLSSTNNTLLSIGVSYLGLFISVLFIIFMAWLGDVPIIL